MFPDPLLAPRRRKTESRTDADCLPRTRGPRPFATWITPRLRAARHLAFKVTTGGDPGAFFALPGLPLGLGKLWPTR